MRPYHKYVFDAAARRFVGNFEEMYQAEQAEGFDSWHQGTLTTLQKQISLAILNQFNFQTVLDVGCGKGHFTHLLKKQNNQVIGIDVAPTAVQQARAHYPDIDFRVMGAGEIGALGLTFDLVVAMEVLSYCQTWNDLLTTFARVGRRLFLSLYLPDDPIGFVKSFDELRSAVKQHFQIETDIVQDSHQVYLLARSSRLA